MDEKMDKLAHEACEKAIQTYCFGKSDSYKEGYREGFLEGFREGWEKEEKKIIRLLLPKGFTIEKLAELLDITEDKVKKYGANMNREKLWTIRNR